MACMTTAQLDYEFAGNRLYDNSEMQTLALKVRHSRPLTGEDRRQWDLASPLAHDMFTNAGRVEQSDRRRRQRDIRTHGQVAVEFYSGLGLMPPGPTRTMTRVRSCARPAGRPPARRAGSSSSTSSADPGDSDPEPPAAPLRLAPPARAVLTFGCLSAAERGETRTQPFEAEQDQGARS